MVTTIMYAKCDATERLSLWENIYSIFQNTNLPWFVGSDFRVILLDEGNIGRIFMYPRKYEDFDLV